MCLNCLGKYFEYDEDYFPLCTFETHCGTLKALQDFNELIVGFQIGRRTASVTMTRVIHFFKRNPGDCEHHDDFFLQEKSPEK